MKDPVPTSTGKQVAASPATRLRTWSWIGGSLTTAGGIGIAFSGGILPIIALALGLLALLATALAKRSLATPAVGHDARLRELKRYIGKTRYLENVGDLGERTGHQLAQATEQYEGFAHLLKLKFAPTELTYSRYYDAGEQAFLSILDNLSTAATSLHGLNATDLHRLDARLAQLAARDSAESRAELADLRRRRDEHGREVARINELLALNERALTEFNRVRVALTNVQTRKGEADLGLDAAMAELKELARRAERYGKTSGDMHHGA